MTQFRKFFESFWCSHQINPGLKERREEKREERKKKNRRQTHTRNQEQGKIKLKNKKKI